MAKLPLPEPKQATLQEYLALLPGHHVYTAINHEKGRVIDFDSLAAVKPLNKKGFSVYMTFSCINPDPGDKRTKDKFTHANCVYLDDDGADKGGVTDPNQFILRPNARVCTSPGKYQYIWLTFTDNGDELEGVNKHLASKYNGDPSFCDRTRIGRLPGFINHKYESQPVCTVEIYHDKVYDWEEIIKNFPPTDTVVVMDKEEQDFKFNLKTAVQAIYTGESFHEARRYLAMYFANTGQAKETAIASVESIFEDILKTHDLPPSRLKDAMERYKTAKQTINTAYAKVEAEQTALPYMGDGVVDVDDKYSHLPKPIGALKVIADAMMEYSAYPRMDMAVPTALHTISVFGGGLYRLDSFTMTRKRTVLAPTGSGKSSIGKFFNEVTRLIATSGEILNPYNYKGSDTFNKSNSIHSDLHEHRVRSYIRTEAGQYAGSRSGTLAEDMGYTLDILSATYKQEIQAKKYSNRTSENRRANETLRPIYGVCVSILNESVYDSYAEYLKSTDAFRSGMMGREEIIFVEPIKPKRNRAAETSIDNTIINMMIKLARTFEDTGTVTGDSPSNPDKFIPVDTAQINDLLDELSEKYDDLENGLEESDIRRTIYPRIYERVINTVLAQAVADEALRAVRKQDELRIPVCTVKHFDWAVQYQEELMRSLFAQMERGAFANPFDHCMDILTRRCFEFGEHSDDRKQPGFKDKVITTSWVTSILKKRNRSGHVVDRCLDAKPFHGDRSKFNRAILEAAVNDNLLIPLGKSGKYKINREVLKK